MAAGSEGVLLVVGTRRNRLRRGEEKGGGGRVSDKFRFGIGFGRRGFEWIKRVKYSGVECSGRMNAHRLTTGRNERRKR